MTKNETRLRPRRLSPMPWFLAALARLVFRCATRITVEGAENLPQDGAIIVTPNHLSNADPPLIAGWVAPALGRRPRFLAKEQLFVPVIGHFITWQGAIPVKKGGSDPETYRVIKKLLDKGEALIIFPEGTRNPEAVLGTPLPGAALLATRSGVPILPVGISGTDRFLVRGSPMPKFGARITLRIGRPYTLKLNPDLPRREAMAAANDELMGRIAALIDERHRGRYKPVVD
jgi:1-acyl-sn-glycerol-3-phosphate acyltransferase